MANKRYQLVGVLEINVANEAQIVLYINGKEEARKNIPGKLYDYGPALIIGAATSGNDQPFHSGKILSARYYDGALDIEEIRNLK